MALLRWAVVRADSPPPTSLSSSTATWVPRRASIHAVVRPAMPAPTTHTPAAMSRSRSGLRRVPEAGIQHETLSAVPLSMSRPSVRQRPACLHGGRRVAEVQRHRGRDEVQPDVGPTDGHQAEEVRSDESQEAQHQVGPSHDLRVHARGVNGAEVRRDAGHAYHQVSEVVQAVDGKGAAQEMRLMLWGAAHEARKAHEGEDDPVDQRKQMYRTPPVRVRHTKALLALQDGA